MIKLLRFLKDYKKETVLAPLFKMLEAIFDLLVPFVVAQIIDRGINNDDTVYVWKMGGVLLVLAFVGLAFSLTAQYFAAKAAAGFGTQLRHALFSHIQKLSYTQLDQQGTSTLITRMTSDVNIVQSQVNMAIRLLLRSPFIVFGAMIMAFFIDVKTALIFVIAIPVLSVIVYGIMLITIPLYKKVQGALDTVMGSTRENLAGARVIRAFNKEKEEIENYENGNEVLKAFQIFAGKISGIMNPATLVAVNIATVAILWVGGKQVYVGNLTQGEVVALVNLMAQILVELIKLANLIINLTKAFACANRINGIFDIEIDMKEGSLDIENIEELDNASQEYIVELENVAIKYEGALENSIEAVNLKVKKGETVGIIGSTGSGKTTLVNLLPRFYDATEGVVKVNGIDVKEYKTSTLRDMFGIVLQKALLFQGTIRSNLLWGNENASEGELIEALKISQSYDFVMEKEGQLDAAVSQNGKNFSGGQRQRLTIARALVRKPQILILDDSSSALDNATDLRLRKSIREIDGITTFIVSQRTSAIMDADQILVLDDGQVVGIGSHNELLDSCEVYQDIYQSQFRKVEGK